MGVPIYIRIQQFIKAQIASGEWPEDSLIPTEAELSRQFGCSRITVTTALRELVKDGVIYRIQGKGTYVSKYSNAGTLYEKADLAQMTLSLEAMSIPGEHKCINIRVERPTEEVAKILRLGPEQSVIAVDRMKYVDGKPFAVERMYLPQLLYSLVLENHLENQYVAEFSKTCGITIGKSFISSEPVICDADICALLDIPAGSPIFKFNIEIHDMQEHPVACEIVFTKGHQNKLLLS